MAPLCRKPALLISTSMRPALARTESTQAFTEASEVTSSASISTRPAADPPLRLVPNTRCPSCASLEAMAAPIPVELPVTRMILDMCGSSRAGLPKRLPALVRHLALLRLQAQVDPPSARRHARAEVLDVGGAELLQLRFLLLHRSGHVAAGRGELVPVRPEADLD